MTGCSVAVSWLPDGAEVMVDGGAMHLVRRRETVAELFAGEARLIIDDSSTTDGGGNLVPNASGLGIRFEINQRYVQDVSDTAARVAILSVNGDQDVDDTVTPAVVTNGDLLVPDVITVAVSRPGDARS